MLSTIPYREWALKIDTTRYANANDMKNIREKIPGFLILFFIISNTIRIITTDATSYNCVG
jgi:hypothetical protein